MSLSIIASVQKVITSLEMREIDRQTTERYSIPSLLLMEMAARASARAIAARFNYDLRGKTVQIYCGRGNNGGDGAALARVLWLEGARVNVVLIGKVDETKGDARTNFEIVRHLADFSTSSGSNVPPLSFIECIDVTTWERVASPRRDFDIRVDALFGTGLTRPLDGIPLQVVEYLSLIRNARDRADSDTPLFVSLDIPSGINADQPELIGAAVRADLTITFTAPKPGNVLPPASHNNGELVIAGIGSPPALVEGSESRLFLTQREDAAAWLEQTRYAPDSYKNSHGHAFVIAGARGFTGAAVLASNAAMRSGAGLVTVATPASAQQAIAARLLPEVMTASLAETDRGAVSDEAIEHAVGMYEQASVVALGPGLTSDDDRTRRFVRAIVERRKTPMVIDADGLNSLSPWPAELSGSSDLPIVLTPHIGEMRRLIGAKSSADAADRVEVAREFATTHSLIVVLKGSRTLVAAPDGSVFVNPTGNPGLGTAGAGDTLTGIITGFLAQSVGTFGAKADSLAATLAAVYVGGLAGDIAARTKGMRSMVASDIRDYLSDAFMALDPLGEQP